MEWVYPDKKEEPDEEEPKEEEPKEEEPKEEDAEEEEPKEEEPKEEDAEEEVKGDPYKSIIHQRKAFVDWVNDVFYKEVLDSYKGRSGDEEEIKIYQYFVKKYLSIEAPLRGL